VNIYIYSDESGVFDKTHNEHFVYSGIIFLSKEEKNTFSHLYSNAEKIVRSTKKIPIGKEIKATTIDNVSKYKLYRSLNKCYKFGVVIHQPDILTKIFENKKDKQRYLDYAYKIGIKRFFQYIISKGIIDPSEVKYLRFYVDEHTTATSGIYELRESLEQEFKRGTYNHNYNLYFPPIFANLDCVDLTFCNSASSLLVRAADIVANHIYYLARNNKNLYNLPNNLFVTQLPENKFEANEETI
jgi:hypothetical protein